MRKPGKRETSVTHVGDMAGAQRASMPHVPGRVYSLSILTSRAEKIMWFGGRSDSTLGTRGVTCITKTDKGAARAAGTSEPGADLKPRSIAAISRQNSP